MRGSAVVWLTPEEARQKWCVKSVTPASRCVASDCMGWVAESEGKVVRPGVTGVNGLYRPPEIVHALSGRGRCGLVRE